MASENQKNAWQSIVDSLNINKVNILYTIAKESQFVRLEGEQSEYIVLKNGACMANLSNEMINHYTKEFQSKINKYFNLTGEEYDDTVKLKFIK